MENSSVKRKYQSCQDANFVIIGYILGCHYDNQRCHQSWRIWHHGNSRFGQLSLQSNVHYIQPHPHSKVHGANMGPIWGRQDPGGPHVGPMNFAIWALSDNWLAILWSLYVLIYAWLDSLLVVCDPYTTRAINMDSLYKVLVSALVCGIIYLCIFAFSDPYMI